MKNILNSNIKSLLQEALQCHRTGALDRAELLYQTVIEKQPNHPDALHLLGIIEHQKGDYALAETLIRKAIVRDKKAPIFYLNLGNTLKEQGKISEAIESYKKAIRLEPRFAEAYYNLANELFIQDDVDNAIKYYRKTIALNPNIAEAHYNLGKALRTQDRINEATECYQRALQIKPDFAEAHYNLGVIFQDQKRYEDSIESYIRSIQIKPDYIEALYNLGNVFRDQEKFKEAEYYYGKALEIKPDFIEAYNNLGIALRQQGQIENALKTCQLALTIKPDFAEAHNNIGIALREDGRLEEAIESCRRATIIKPQFAEGHWNLSLALLHFGDFAKGWRKYEWRFLKKDAVLRYFPYPRWDGSSLKGKTLLVYAEQGIGDQIMFTSLLSEIINQCSLCIVECDNRLVPLFSRSFPSSMVVPMIKDDHLPNLPSIDLKIPMGSLPLFLRPYLEDFSQENFYLIPDPQKTDEWHARFKELGDGLKIGISWRGGKEAGVRHIRSTSLEQWADLFALKGVHFINLQYGECAKELREAREKFGMTVHDWEDADPLKDLNGFAAQISALDLVISVDNSTVHMAGALGVPVWALLPKGCDWRWMSNFEDTPWYESVRLFRQINHGDWKEVFERVSSNLKQYKETGEIPSMDIRYSYKNSRPVISELDEPFRPIMHSYSEKTYRCAVITPVGPGHEVFYENCLASIEKSFAGHKGRFSEIIPIKIDDHEGKLGRSKARNLGVKKAAERDIEWIFFLDADDLMALSTFEYVSPYLDNYDGVWGSIWSIEQGEEIAKERPGQLPFLYSIEDVLSCDPFVTLQMGHFIKTSIALAASFDESLDAGEDFDYYMRIWERHRCIKIPLPFFYNRRGHHSQGVRSATGAEWRQTVEDIQKQYRPGKVITFSYKGEGIKFYIDNYKDLIQQCYLLGRFFEDVELEFIANNVKPNSVIVEVGANIGNHAIYYEKFMDPSKIILIEPNPNAIALIKRNIEINYCTKMDTSLLGIGVGKERGRFSLQDAQLNNLGASRLEPDPDGEITVAPLDELINEKLSFIKIDVENMEMDALAGAQGLIEAYRPDIFIEIMNKNIPEFLDFLERIHYHSRKEFKYVNAVNFYIVPEKL
jgi:FkbM family methyltransferase